MVAVGIIGQRARVLPRCPVDVELVGVGVLIPDARAAGEDAIGDRPERVGVDGEMRVDEGAWRVLVPREHGLRQVGQNLLV
jgi:hypothetical protein